MYHRVVYQQQVPIKKLKTIGTCFLCSDKNLVKLMVPAFWSAINGICNYRASK